jgi:hypothetical protein
MMGSWIDHNLPTFASWFDRNLRGRLLWLLGCAVMFIGMAIVFSSFLGQAGAGAVSGFDPEGQALEAENARLLVFPGGVTMLAAAGVFLLAKQLRAAAWTSLQGSLAS